MWNFVFWAIITSFRENKILCLFLKPIFTILKNKKVDVVRLLATTLSPLG
jgi:hypothetical protein